MRFSCSFICLVNLFGYARLVIVPQSHAYIYMYKQKYIYYLTLTKVLLIISIQLTDCLKISSERKKISTIYVGITFKQWIWSVSPLYSDVNIVR